MWSTLTRRTRLQRTPFVRRRLRNPVTRETRALMYERAGGRCEIGVCCGGMLLPANGWEYSHRVRRRDSPSHGPEAGMVACRDCHAYLPQQRAIAEGNGWLLPFATEYLHLQPALIGGRWWLLGRDGGRIEVRLP
jgi:hypothetical protein